MIRINPLFFIMIIFVILSGLVYEFMIVFAIAFVHEMGHALCASVLGYKIIKISFQPWGVCMTTEAFRSAKHAWLIAASGPAVNVLLLLAGFLIPSELFLIANIFMLIINLLPVYPLDGGRIMLAFLETELDQKKAKLIIRIVSGITTILLFFAGGILLYKTKINFSVLLAALFIALTTDGKSEEKIQIYQTFCKTKHYCVQSSEPLKNILKIKNKHDFIILDVVNERFEYIGSLTMCEVMESIAKNGYEIKIDEILRKQLLY